VAHGLKHHQEGDALNGQYKKQSFDHIADMLGEQSMWEIPLPHLEALKMSMDSSSSKLQHGEEESAHISLSSIFHEEEGYPYTKENCKIQFLSTS
jgi:hypothetical protein